MPTYACRAASDEQLAREVCKMRAWTAIGAPSLLADEAAVALMLRRCVPADGMRACEAARARARERASEQALNVQFRIEQLCGA